MGHIPLQKYLHQIGKTNSSVCPACKQGEESIHHFLFNCRSWQHKRWHIGKKLGRLAKSTECMLNTPEGVKELMAFVRKMARLKGTYGDVPHVL